MYVCVDNLNVFSADTEFLNSPQYFNIFNHSTFGLDGSRSQETEGAVKEVLHINLACTGVCVCVHAWGSLVLTPGSPLPSLNWMSWPSSAIFLFLILCHKLLPPWLI